MPVFHDDGSPAGEVPRSVMRRDNLLHRATGVLLRNSAGQVYVHRRTDSKDVFPGMFDCCAGGVVVDGEEPYAAAVRELDEELGVRGVPLRFVTRQRFANDATRYDAFVYEASWDGPVRHQADEVAWGGWMDAPDLLDLLRDPARPFVPDSAALVGRWLEQIGTSREIADGWDSLAWVVDGIWLDREPRRPQVVPQLLAETSLLPWLAPQLPLPVPQPWVLRQSPLRVRHRLLVGTRISGGSAVHGTVLGRFLRGLHGISPEGAATRGVCDPTATLQRRAADRRDFADKVLPLLGSDLQPAARALLDAFGSLPAPDSVVHGDLGPDHVLVDGGSITGVIDWGDCHVGDPAIDLAWTLHGTCEPFSAALAAAYGVDDELRRRALVWHRLGPWHEVMYGLDFGKPDYVASGLSGVAARLR